MPPFSSSGQTYDAFLGTVTIASGISISNTPNVVVTNSPSVSITGTPNVAVTGTPNVAVTNTPNVAVTTIPNITVSSMPAVSITGTPNVAISGTPNVSVTNTPNVAVTSIPAVTLTSGANVFVTNTPDVNVLSIPNVTLAGTPNVAITNQPTVTVASGANVNITGGIIGQGPPAIQLSTNAWPIRLVDGTNNRAATIDTSTNAINIVDYVHHEIHSGSAFSVYDRVDVTGAATNRDYLIITPDTTKWSHMRIEYTTEAEFDIFLYEATTTSNDGTPIASYNRNRNSATAAGTTLFHTPTVTGVGTQLRVRRSGSGTTLGGGNADVDEWILKQNTKYLLRFKKISTGTHYISLKVLWYEHTDKTS